MRLARMTLNSTHPAFTISTSKPNPASPELLTSLEH